MHKKRFVNVLCFLLVSVLLLTGIPAMQVQAADTGAAQLFIATDGDDTAAGTVDAPLQTLEAARDKIRQMKANGTYPEAGVIVNIMGGEYLRIGDSFTLGVQDSGTAEGPVIYRAYNNEEVVFTGVLDVDGSDFEPVTEERILARLDDDVEDNVLVYDIGAKNGITEFAPFPKNGQGWDPQKLSFEFSVDGDLQTLARYPNSNDEMLKTTTILSTGAVPRSHEYVRENGVLICTRCTQEKGTTVKYHSQAWFRALDGGVFTTNNAYLKAKYDLLIQEKELWAFGYWTYEWAYDQCSVEKIEETDNGLQISLGEPSWYGVGGEVEGTVSKSAREFYLFNALCELDAPGEYYLDREHAKLYYYPNPEKALADSKVSFIMQPNSLVVMNGAKYVQWQNISFGDGNACGMEVKDCEYVEIAGCKFDNFGMQAITISGSNNTVRSCDITNIGQGGITVRGGDVYTLTRANNVVVNCDISNYAITKRTYAPAIDIFGCGNSALRNRIYDAPHFAIQFAGVYTTIEGNEIYDVCYETADTGAIYCGRTWYGVRGSVVKNNYVHDMVSNSGGGSCAVYLDDMASGVTITENLFVNLQGLSGLIGGGRDNVYTNNILINETNNGGVLSYGDRGIGGMWFSAAGPNGSLVSNITSFFNNEQFDEEAEKVWREQFPEVLAIDLTNYRQHAEYGKPDKVSGTVRGEGYEKWYYNAGTPACGVITNNITVGAAEDSYGNVCDAVKENGTFKDNQRYIAGTNIGFTNADSCDYTVIAGSTIKALMGDNHYDVGQSGLYRDEYRTILPGELEMTLETSKSVYGAEEKVNVLVTVKNPGSALIKNIRTEITVPEGLKWESGSLTMDSFDLAAGASKTGETVVLSLVKEAEPTATPTTAPTATPTAESTATPTAEPTTSPELEDEVEILIEGTDKSYTLGTNGNSSIHCTGKLDELESVEMDGKVVDESNYTTKEGSTIITFKAAYLDTLSVGDHTVTLNYSGGRSVDMTLTCLAPTATPTAEPVTPPVEEDQNDASGNDQSDNTSAEQAADNAVQEASSTTTGDTAAPLVWLTLMVAAVAGIAFLLYKNKKLGNRLMSLVLALVVAASLLPCMPVEAAEDTETKGYSVSTVVNVDGKDYTITAEISYDEVSTDAVVTVNKTELQTLVTEANTLLDEAIVGTDPGQWSQGAKDALQAAVTPAQTVFEATDADQWQVNAAVTTLKNAIEVFEDSKNAGAQDTVEATKVDVSTLIADEQNWSKFESSSSSYTFENEGLTILSNSGYANARYTGKKFKNAEFSFTYTAALKGTTASDFGGFYIQSGTANYPWQSKGVAVIAKSDKVELQLYGATNQTFIAEGDYLNSGVEHEVIFGLCDVSDTDVRVTLTVDGQVLFNKVVTDNVLLSSENYFGVLASPNGQSVTLEGMEEIVYEGLYYSFYDFEGITASNGTLTRSEEEANSGHYSYKVDENKDSARIQFDTQEKNVLSVWLYDDMSTTDDGIVMGIVNGDIMLGIRNTTENGTQYYTMAPKYSEGWQITTAPRSKGWHELKWDFTDGETCKLYIDDIHVGTREGVKSYYTITLGNIWGNAANGNKYFDDLKIGNPQIAENVVSITVPENEASVTLEATETHQINAVAISNPDIDVALTYTSANASVATVSADGVITAVAAGTTEITVQSAKSVGDADAKKATVTVTVTGGESSEQTGGLYYSFYDFTGVEATDGELTRSDEQAHSGHYSYKVDEKKDSARIKFDTQEKNVLSVWLYDDMSTTDDGIVMGIVQGDIMLGIRNTTEGGKEYYTMAPKYSSEGWKITTAPRSKGWHELKWDFTDGETCKLYIDDIHVGTRENITSYYTIKLGNIWGNAATNGNKYFDDLKIGNPQIAENVVSITVPENEASVTLEATETHQINAVAISNPDIDVALIYTSANASVATVSADGVITAVAAGTTTITVQSTKSVGDADAKKATVTVTVTGGESSEQTVDTIIVEPETVEVEVEKTAQITATAKNAAGIAIEGETFEYTSNDTTVATVSENGLITAVKPGITTVLIKSTSNPDKTAEVTVKVYKVVYSHGFEVADSDLVSKAGTITISNEQYHSGSYSLKVDEDTDYIRIGFDPAKSKNVVSIWLYDDMSEENKGIVMAILQGSVMLGIHPAQSSTEYIMQTSGTWQKTGVLREKGWHELKWDFTDGKNGKLYIDGTYVGVKENISSYVSIVLGDQWSGNTFGNKYFDDLKIISYEAQ